MTPTEYSALVDGIRYVIFHGLERYRYAASVDTVVPNGELAALLMHQLEEGPLEPLAPRFPAEVSALRRADAPTAPVSAEMIAELRDDEMDRLQAEVADLEGQLAEHQKFAAEAIVSMTDAHDHATALADDHDIPERRRNELRTLALGLYRVLEQDRPKVTPTRPDLLLGAGVNVDRLLRWLERDHESRAVILTITVGNRDDEPRQIGYELDAEAIDVYGYEDRGDDGDERGWSGAQSRQDVRYSVSGEHGWPLERVAAMALRLIGEHEQPVDDGERIHDHHAD